MSQLSDLFGQQPVFDMPVAPSHKREEYRSIIQQSELIRSRHYTFDALDNDEYHNNESRKFDFIPFNKILSGSLIKQARTVRHIQQYIAQERTNKDCFRTGTAWHDFIEKIRNLTDFSIFDDTEMVNELTSEGSKNPRLTKKYKEWAASYYDKDEVLLPGYLTPDEYQSLAYFKTFVDAHNELGVLLNQSAPETSYFAKLSTPDEHELHLKIRPDLIATVGNELHAIYAPHFDAIYENRKFNPGDILYTSIKSSRETTPESFYYEARRMQYFISEAFYIDTLEKIHSKPVHAQFLVIDKSTALAFIVLITPEQIEEGRRMLDRNIQNYFSWKQNPEQVTGFEILNNNSIIFS
jgi:hypothetical protein